MYNSNGDAKHVRPRDRDCFLELYLSSFFTSLVSQRWVHAFSLEVRQATYKRERHVFMPTSVHTCIHTYMHACIYTYNHTYMHAYTCTHKYIHTYMHTYIHTYIHTCSHAYIHTQIIVSMHTYTDRQTEIHTSTHTHVHTFSRGKNIQQRNIENSRWAAASIRTTR